MKKEDILLGFLVLLFCMTGVGEGYRLMFGMPGDESLADRLFSDCFIGIIVFSSLIILMVPLAAVTAALIVFYFYLKKVTSE